MRQILIFLFFLCTTNIVAQESVEKTGSAIVQSSKLCRLDAYSPRTGLKILVEGGYAVGAGVYGEEHVSFLATVGYRFSPYFFVGVGAGENYYVSSDKYGLPFYGNLRLNLLNISVSPYLDAKIGYSTTDVDGLFISPSVGCSWTFSDKIAFTVSLGYEYQRANCFKADYFIDTGNPKYAELLKSKNNFGAMTLKIGFEF